jgi:hypothetical protein
MVDEIKYNKLEIGEEFITQLDEVLKIRKERKLIYGDSFLNEDVASLLNIIDGKRHRLDMLLKMESRHPKVLDEIRDIVNYYLFVLCVLNTGGRYA